MNINQVISAPEYNFLREDKQIAGRIMFLTLGGSHAYGTNVPESDVDVRGCVLPAESDLLGLTHFEQLVDSATDTAIYSFPKLIRLLTACNPNCIELLGGRPEFYTQVSPAGRLLLENRKLFLSKLAIESFGGYAKGQLARLQNAMARDRMSQPAQERHILDACQRTLANMNGRYQAASEGGIRLSIAKSQKQGTDSEIFMDIDLKHYPLRDFVAIWRELNEVAKNYGVLNNRNKKRDDAHLNKHMMHLIRLYMMCLDILEKGEIVTYRAEEHDLLMSIRSGAFMDEAGLVKPEFYEMLHIYQKRFEYAKEHTMLPDRPDHDMVNDLCISINRFALTK